MTRHYGHGFVVALVAFPLGAACSSPTGSPASGGAGDAGVPPPASSSGSSGALPACTSSPVVDVGLSSADMDAAFPPYAAWACTLVYVARDGALVMRDLTSGREERIAEPIEKPRRPAISGVSGVPTVAWEATQDGKRVVRVRTGSAVSTVTGSFVSAGEPRVSGAAVVFTAFLGPTDLDDTDVWVQEGRQATARLAVGGAGQQRFADISAGAIAVTDFSEDPTGVYDPGAKHLADIVVLDRASGAVTARRLPGKQAFPMLIADGRIGYLSWVDVQPQPKFTAYQIRAGGITAPVSADVKIADVVNQGEVPMRPAGQDGVFEWISSPPGSSNPGAAALYRAPADASQPPVAVSGLESLPLFAPAPASRFTVLAVLNGDSLGPRLRAVPR